MGFFKIRPCLVATLVRRGEGAVTLGWARYQSKDAPSHWFHSLPQNLRQGLLNPSQGPGSLWELSDFFHFVYPFVAWYTGWLDKVVANSLTDKKSVMWNIIMGLHNHKSAFTLKSFASSQPFVFEAANNSMAGEQERQEEVANVEHWSLFHTSLRLSSCSQTIVTLDLWSAVWAHGLMWKEQIWKTHTTHQNLARRDLSSLLGLYNHFLREFIGPPVVAEGIEEY